MSPRSFSPRGEKKSPASDSSHVGDESQGDPQATDRAGKLVKSEQCTRWYRPVAGGPHTGQLADRYGALLLGKANLEHAYSTLVAPQLAKPLPPCLKTCIRIKLP
ncbi:hypothetical protein B296_00043912 [Ensete ventricosum]|uniref:Uncharacterized protein n=1 Tax=Ensete ventricosum TaxID=4639 RepID=A0A426Y1C3_ENSVE|nr:hypothetical protein B296_00043912 [Ensete ventricosum]